MKKSAHGQESNKAEYLKSNKKEAEHILFAHRFFTFQQMMKIDSWETTSRKSCLWRFVRGLSWLPRIMKSFMVALCAFAVVNVLYTRRPSFLSENSGDDTPTFNQGTSKQVQLSVWNQATTTCPKTKHSDSIIYIPSVLTSTLRQTLISNIR